MQFIMQKNAQRLADAAAVQKAEISGTMPKIVDSPAASTTPEPAKTDAEPEALLN